MDRTISHHEALIYVMVTISAADRTMTDAEMLKIGDIVKTLPVFRDFDPELLVPTAEAVGDTLNAGGIDSVLDIVGASLPEKLRETAYALAVEVAAADLDVKQEELRFLQLMRDHLDIDKLEAGAIEHSARVRFRML